MYVYIYTYKETKLKKKNDFSKLDIMKMYIVKYFL